LATSISPLTLHDPLPILSARAVIGIFPANSIGDDIEIYTDESRTQVRTTLHHLRQQRKKAPGQPNLCLADFVPQIGLAGSLFALDRKSTRLNSSHVKISY